MKKTFLTLLLALGVPLVGTAQEKASLEQLAKWLKRFPAADTNKDGTLSIAEATAFRDKMLGGKTGKKKQVGAPSKFEVDPGWKAEKFPDHAICYLSPDAIKGLYPDVVSFEKPTDGALRIVGTGHSFMRPGYQTLPKICEAAGFKQPLHTHTGGGITGSARYKWEQENGIFQFDKKPVPKLLASIANAKWDAMMWGPYYSDRPEYYSCWIDFCLKTNPEMKFYLSDSWVQLGQLDEIPKSEDFFTEEIFDKLTQQKRDAGIGLIETLRKKYPDKFFILPTSDAMTLAAKHYLRGELPGIEGINKVIGKKERSIWQDQLGHLGPGFDRLEGYVFYATLYGKSPELIEAPIKFGEADFPSPELDKMFRKIAWQAVINNPFSGVSKPANGAE